MEKNTRRCMAIKAATKKPTIKVGLYQQIKREDDNLFYKKTLFKNGSYQIKYKMKIDEIREYCKKFGGIRYSKLRILDLSRYTLSLKRNYDKCKRDKLKPFIVSELSKNNLPNDIIKNIMKLSEEWNTSRKLNL